MKKYKPNKKDEAVLKAWEDAKEKIKKNLDEDIDVSKFGNKKVTIDGVLYDSLQEYYRHRELMIAEQIGEIKDLKFHAKEDRLLLVSNPDVRYFPDFSYVLPDGTKIVEDVKGMQTPDFIIKKKIVISKIRSGEYNFTFILTRKYASGFEIVERYSKGHTYIRPKKRRKKR